ncbi:MAG: nucleotide sugar dehydrogenase [bacterium]
MNVLYIGSGFVGACSAAVAAGSGHKVLVYDVDENKIKMLSSGDRDTIESCLFEKGLGDLLTRHMDRIKFTTDYNEVDIFLDSCDAIFMCLPTPEIDETGESDLSYYKHAAEKLAQSMTKRNAGSQEKYITIINKSTVPINMMDNTKEIMESAGVKNYGVVSNPEFLVEGKAVEGSLNPDRVVVGADSQQDFDLMRRLYQRFYDSPNVQYLEVNPREAAAGKLLANFYLFHKLMACFDVIGRACESFDGLRFEKIRKILTSDKRIGSWGFYDSLYAGGSCLIKDARSLSHQLQLAGSSADLVNEVYLANKRQLELFLARAHKEAQFDWANKTISVIGTAFKRDTNDIRNSAGLDVVNFLIEKGVKKININDPAASDNFKKVFPPSDKIEYYFHEFDAAKSADAIIIVTDWPQFRGLADSIITELNQKPLIMDGRRMLQHRYEDLQSAGFSIIAVGSPYIKAK